MTEFLIIFTDETKHGDYFALRKLANDTVNIIDDCRGAFAFDFHNGLISERGIAVVTDAELSSDEVCERIRRTYNRRIDRLGLYDVYEVDFDNLGYNIKDYMI